MLNTFQILIHVVEKILKDEYFLVAEVEAIVYALNVEWLITWLIHALKSMVTLLIGNQIEQLIDMFL